MMIPLREEQEAQARAGGEEGRVKDKTKEREDEYGEKTTHAQTHTHTTPHAQTFTHTNGQTHTHTHRANHPNTQS